MKAKIVVAGELVRIAKMLSGAADEFWWVKIALDMNPDKYCVVKCSTSQYAEKLTATAERISDITIFSVDELGSASEEEMRGTFRNPIAVIDAVQQPRQLLKDIYHKLMRAR